MGGYGTWDAIQRRPELFAGAVPICGGGDPDGAEAMKDIPIWVYHGAKDGAVPVARSRQMVEALKKLDAEVHYTEIPDAGHDVWTPAFADEEMLEWLFSQKKHKWALMSR